MNFKNTKLIMFLISLLFLSGCKANLDTSIKFNAIPSSYVNTDFKKMVESYFVDESFLYITTQRDKIDGNHYITDHTVYGKINKDYSKFDKTINLNEDNLFIKNYFYAILTNSLYRANITPMNNFDIYYMMKTQQVLGSQIGNTKAIDSDPKEINATEPIYKYLIGYMQKNQEELPIQIKSQVLAFLKREQAKITVLDLDEIYYLNAVSELLISINDPELKSAFNNYMNYITKTTYDGRIVFFMNSLSKMLYMNVYMNGNTIFSKEYLSKIFKKYYTAPSALGFENNEYIVTVNSLYYYGIARHNTNIDNTILDLHLRYIFQSILDEQKEPTQAFQLYQTQFIERIYRQNSTYILEKNNIKINNIVEAYFYYKMTGKQTKDITYDAKDILQNLAYQYIFAADKDFLNSLDIVSYKNNDMYALILDIYTDLCFKNNIKFNKKDILNWIHTLKTPFGYKTPKGNYNFEFATMIDNIRIKIESGGKYGY